MVNTIYKFSLFFFRPSSFLLFIYIQCKVKHFLLFLLLAEVYMTVRNPRRYRCIYIPVESTLYMQNRPIECPLKIYLYKLSSKYTCRIHCALTELPTFRTLIGVRRILATSKATLPWPNITTFSVSKSTFSCKMKHIAKTIRIDYHNYKCNLTNKEGMINI